MFSSYSYSPQDYITWMLNVMAAQVVCFLVFAGNVADVMTMISALSATWMPSIVLNTLSFAFRVRLSSGNSKFLFLVFLVNQCLNSVAKSDQEHMNRKWTLKVFILVQLSLDIQISNLIMVRMLDDIVILYPEDACLY